MFSVQGSQTEIANNLTHSDVFELGRVAGNKTLHGS